MERVSESRSFQDRASTWAIDCLGKPRARDPVERNQRFLEEALELVQAAGCTASEAHQLVDWVFSEPVGDVGPEVGSVLLTLAQLCSVHGVDMTQMGWADLEGVEARKEEVRQRHEKKPRFVP